MGVNGENDAVLAELWSTPVGRRWLLKAGLGSAVAAAVGLRRAPAAAARQASRRAVGASTLQFALDSAGGVSDLVLVAGGVRHRLRAHSRASRLALRAKGGLWTRMDLSTLTHYAEAVPLPTERGMLLSVQGRRGGREVVVSQIWHAPPRATIALARTSRRLTGTLDQVLGSSQRLSALGLSASDVRSAAQVAELDSIATPYQAATALTMTHPNVTTIDPTATAVTKVVLADTPEVTALGSQIAKMQRAGQDYANLDQATDPDGSPSLIKVGEITTPFSIIALSTDRKFTEATRASVRAGIRAVRDTESLGAVIDKPLDEEPRAAAATWVQPEGVAPHAERYSVEPMARAGVEVKLKDGGTQSGTQTVLRGGYADGKVPVRLYNNYLRWLWVYVQYLGANGENLSLNPNAKFPDSKYSKSLAVVPQVFTVFGGPLVGTNTVEFTLDFPAEAHTARLLYCGLGREIAGNGWRQYFPPDAYPDRIAPTDEVLVPALTTGIITIGLNVFAFATDVDITRVWTAIKPTVSNPELMTDAVLAMIDGSYKLPAAEATAVAVASGVATYGTIAHGGESLENLWNILLRLGGVIPKVVFSARVFDRVFADVAKALLAEATGQKLINALPAIGQALAVIAVVGDLLNLAEVGAETYMSPWVIENEVSLSYGVSVTVSRDPRSATFPTTARSWRIEALVDGALAAGPMTGSINQGGHIRSDPLTLQLTAPFGGRRITWSIVLLDAAGRQVATGVSAPLANDDPRHPPNAVSIELEQVPAVITDTTVFVRSDTTVFDPRVGGYTWSDQVTDTGTVHDHGIQEITSAAVATLAGVAGVVFKQNDRYYIRGVPVAEDTDTIVLGAARREGYARRPFLLLDSLVDARDRGNHVLLEPDENSAAYHVRRVTLDGKTGALTWDPAVSYGTFPLAVSAAALHSSGRIVAINTNSGRLGWLEPVDTSRPQLADYAAGAGEQTGLLTSPIAVAVTNPGIVLVLEAAGQQISAFDLNGNPVRYFGPDRDQFTCELVSTGTYLDLAVDGANQIYTLYFTGDGANPADYHIDVYTDSGHALDTHSPGVNVPRLAIDYWRSIYAPNYNPLVNQGTNVPHIDPALGVSEPSLSRFDPT